MVIVTHESYDSVLVGTGKQKGLESLSENREWRRWWLYISFFLWHFHDVKTTVVKTAQVF